LKDHIRHNDLTRIGLKKAAVVAIGVLCTMIVAGCGGDDDSTSAPVASTPPPASVGPVQPPVEPPKDPPLEPSKYPAEVQKHLAAATINAAGDKDLINYIRRNSCFEVEDDTWRTWARSHIGQTVPLLQIFDDLWFSGDKYTGMYFLKTADGGIMVIDTLNDTKDADTFIIPALQKLGLPLRGIYITHGHADHDGGVARLREVYGNSFPVFLGSGDVPSKAYQPTPIDSTNETVQPVTIGGTRIYVQAAPGHTPGNQISLIPVHQNGVRHLLVMNWRSAVPSSAAGSKQYMVGIERVYWMAKAYGAEGFIHTHAISDATLPTINQIMETGKRESLPVFFGPERTTRATAVARECSAARAQQIDATASFPVWRVTKMALTPDAAAPRKMAARLESGWGPVVGQPVTFTVNSSVAACTAVTNDSGVAQCESLANVIPGDKIKASFNGHSTDAFNDLPSEATNGAK
jgi:hypothetical protein